MKPLGGKFRYLDIDDKRAKKIKAFLCHCLLMLILVLIVYWQYLTGQRLYVFTDIASDSAGQTYPNLVYLAREISAGNIMNRWNFTSSIGNAAEMILPKLANLEAYFGMDRVAYLMGFNMAVKVFLSGIFFYLYLRKMALSSTTSSIFSVLYAFCGQMIVRGAWRSYPNEVLTFAIWLYAYESWFHNGKSWWKLLLASVFLYFNSSGYYVVLYTGIFIAYAVFRIIADWDLGCIKFRMKEILTFAVMTMCALLVSSIGWLGSITTQLKSERFSSGTGKLVAFDWFNLFTDFETLRTAFYRTIGTDILGINDYYGTGNFLEAPTFYCGLLTLVLLPTIYMRTKGKKKIAYSVGLIGIALYIFVRPVRLVANGLAGYSFKLAPLWVMVLMLHIAANGFEEILESRTIQKTGQTFATAIAIIVVAVCFITDGVSLPKLGITVVFLALYVAAVLLCACGKINIRSAKTALLFLTTAEVLFTSFGCVNDRGTMDENIYEDGTMEALAFINDTNNGRDDFCRVDKNYQALSYCDALYQDYMGTVGYIGGSGDRKSTGDFYKAVSMTILGGNNHGMTGFSASTHINTLMNVKYILSDTGMNTNFGYKTLGKVGNITVYENQYALPLGYVYDKYTTLDEYMELPVETRRNVLMELCVLDDPDESLGMEKAMVNPENADDIVSYEIVPEIDITEVQVDITLPQREETEACIIALDIESNGSNSSMMRYHNHDGDVIEPYLGISGGRDTYYLEINDFQIELIQIFNTHRYDIKEIKVYQIPKDIYYKEYINQCNELGKNGLKVEKIDCNNIEGSINSGKDGLMTFAIPYDINWHVYVDGVEHELRPVNIAMMGTDITKGTHEVKLIYHKEGVFWNYLFAGLAVLVLLIVFDFMRSRRSID